jgi:cellulose synthase/poly-beta-1,6-N-acetylglucosamine synthase-like glycosyltransferase
MPRSATWRTCSTTGMSRGGHNRRAADDTWLAARASLESHLGRLDLPAEIEDGLLPGSFRIRYRVRGEPLVSIIVPTKNQVDLLRACLTSLIEGTGYSHCEVLVVDNGSDDAETLAYLQSLRDLGTDSLKVLSCPGPFNFSAMNNLAARQARGEYLLLLNNDTQVLHEDWLEEMLGYAQRPDVGAVGARLLYRMAPSSTPAPSWAWAAWAPTTFSARPRRMIQATTADCACPRATRP